MPKNMNVPFAKFHGLGNDWLVLGGENLPRPLTKFARAILDRHTGIGADGLLVMMPPRDKKHEACIRFFNADGSEAEMSGNGIRCGGAFLAELSPNRRTFLIETAAGVKSLGKVKEGKGKWLFRVGMGAPILDPEKLPFLKAPGLPVPVEGGYVHVGDLVARATVTSMGNPHCSIFVGDFDQFDVGPGFILAPAETEGATSLEGVAVHGWEGVGRVVERSPFFPNRTNVEFVKVISRREIEVRFWERGVGHTMSSGTGACAASVASILNGLTDRQVRVRTEAGALQVEWPDNEEVILTGPVERVAQGIYNYR